MRRPPQRGAAPTAAQEEPVGGYIQDARSVEPLELILGGMIRRDLANVRPEVFTLELATSLVNSAKVLGGLGRHEEALKPNMEAAGLHRDFARMQPEAFTRRLA